MRALCQTLHSVRRQSLIVDVGGAREQAHVMVRGVRFGRQSVLPREASLAGHSGVPVMLKLAYLADPAEALMQAWQCCVALCEGLH